MLDRRLTSTAFEISGYKIVANLGVVRGLTVRSRNMFSTMGAGFKQMIGGQIGAYIKLCEQSREEALVYLCDHAEQMGANAIIGLRYDANEISPGVNEVLAYGTAVVVEKI